MANIKFSQFTVETAKADVDFLVGYSGPDNIQISPTNLLADYSQGTGAAGQVTFFSATSTVTGDNDFYWDNTNKRLGIGTASPTQNLDVDGAIITEDYRSSGTFFLTSGDDWRFRSDTGSERMRINSAGNVGIGTNNPAAKLHVNGTLIATGISQLGSGGSNVLLTSSSAGNVGIGTSSPSTKLEVNGTVHLGSGGNDVTIGASNSSVIFMMRAGYNYIQASDASGAIMFRTGGGNNRMIIDSSGNVGIGTTSPSAPLDVISSGGGAATAIMVGGAANGNIKTRHIEGKSASSTANGILHLNYYGTDDVTLAYGGGNVGIGTNSPASKLSIDASVQDTLAMNSSDGDGPYAVWRRQGSSIGFVGNSNALSASGNTNFGVRATNDLVFAAGGASEKMRITSSGNVGIGTSSPQGDLHVVGKTGTAGRIYLSDKDEGTSGTDSLLAMKLDADAYYYNRDSGKLFLGTNNDSTHLVINSNGNVGIGTISPSKKLEVVSNTTYDGIQISGSSIPTLGIIDTTNNAKLVAYVRDSDAAIGTETNHPLTINTNNAERMRITSGGDVGIGSTSPTSKLTVAVGDIETSGVGYGLILKSPNGTRYRVTVDNSGNLSTTAV